MVQLRRVQLFNWGNIFVVSYCTEKVNQNCVSVLLRAKLFRGKKVQGDYDIKVEQVSLIRKAALISFCPGLLPILTCCVIQRMAVLSIFLTFLHIDVSVSLFLRLNSMRSISWLTPMGPATWTCRCWGMELRWSGETLAHTHTFHAVYVCL